MSRSKRAASNIIWAIVSQLFVMILGLATRKIFLLRLGQEYLGVNSLFGDLLAIFSFAEMGIGTTISFFLYKPISDGDENQVRSLLLFLRRLYWIIVGLIALIGLAFIPFLGFLNTVLPYQELLGYYLIYILNNLLSYIFVYKETYLTACQRESALTKVNLVFLVLQAAVQFTVLYGTSSFYGYLLCGTGFVLLKKTVLNFYINKRYPILRRLVGDFPDKDTKRQVFKKTFSMFVHKVGNLAINQTDSLIVSYMISVAEWGLVSTYLVIKNAISSVTARIYSALLPSVGNLVAQESEESQLDFFNMYDFCNAWLYMFCFTALFALSTPFISLLYGAENTIADITVFLLCLAFFIDGLRSPVSIMREASGLFEKDKWFTLIAAGVNLVSSILFVFWLGLPGIYLGTILAMLVLIISRAIILFRYSYKSFSSGRYFLRLAVYTCLAVSFAFACHALCAWITTKLGLNIWSFALAAVVVIFLPNVAWALLFFPTSGFKLTWRFVRSKIKRR